MRKSVWGRFVHRNFRIPCFFFCAALFQALQLASADTGNNRESKLAVIASSDIARGDKVPEPQRWSAVLLLSKGLGISTCSGAFLSSRFVITARHCVYDKGAGKARPLKEVAIIQRGQFTPETSMEDGLQLKDIKDSYKGDIALLELTSLPAFPVESLPIYHGYQGTPGAPVIAYGTSRLSNDGYNFPRDLYWATLEIAKNSWISNYEDRGYSGETYMAERYDGPALDATMYPPPGMGQPGDSGGTLHAYLPQNRHYPSTKRPDKAIGISSAVDQRDGLYVAAALDDEALRWAGQYVGIILAPHDGAVYIAKNTIDVEVTEASTQPITSIELLDMDQKVVSSCTTLKSISGGILGCALPAPADDGPYTVRALRSSDGSFDEVMIEYNIVDRDEGSGLQVCCSIL